MIVRGEYIKEFIYCERDTQCPSRPGSLFSAALYTLGKVDLLFR
jgi:hypothetical protein